MIINRGVDNKNSKSFVFTCVMAVWNTEEYLDEAIKSIINQTLDFEEYIQLILINDGSTDNSGKICLDYEKKYPNNIYYIERENSGTSSARNEGLKYAKGHYINFIDSDDYFTANALNKINSYFIKNKGVDVATIEMLSFSEESTQEKSSFYDYYKKTQTIDLDNSTNFAIFNPGMIFIRKSALDGLQFNTDLKIGEDINYYYRVLINNPLCGVIKNEKYMHRIRLNSATTSIREVEDTTKLVDIVLQELINYSIEKKGHLQLFISDLCLNILVFEILLRLENENKTVVSKFVPKIKNILKFIEEGRIADSSFVSDDYKELFLKMKGSTEEECLILLCGPKVSIIIPVYNGANYVREAIDSALAQTYKNIEIIVVNDGSTDGGATEKIARSYGDKIRYYGKSNGGVSTALNFGIKKMTGDYFSWLSHDDTYGSNKIESEIKYLKNNNSMSKKVILYSDYYLMDKRGKIISECTKNHDELCKKPEYALLKGDVNGLTLLIPKEAFKEHGLFDVKLKCTQDYELWRKMARTYQFVHIPELLVSSRYHAKQVSNTSPLVKVEGNALYLGLIKDVTKKRREELEGSEYCFFEELATFYKNTPYDEAEQYCLDNMKKIFDATNVVRSLHKVSIVIPFYNRGSKVKRALESVFRQTYDNFEVILVDDGSTDDISNVKRLIAGRPNVKLFRLSKNSGVSTARNKGINESTGEYVAFLDSDDEFMPEKIEKQLKYMMISGNPMSHTSYVRDVTGRKEVVRSGKDFGHCERKSMYSCLIATPTVMLDAKWLKKNKVEFNQNIGLGEDTCLWLQILKTSYLVGIDEPLSTVHVNDSSSVYNTKKQIVGLKNIINFLLDDEYYSQLDFELAEVMQMYAKHVGTSTTKHNGVLAPKYNNSKIIRNLNKIVFFTKNEGLKSVVNRAIKKIRKGKR